MRFKNGDRIRIRQWDDMEKEFGLDSDGDIYVGDGSSFIQDMKHLCGREATIVDCSNEDEILLDNWSDFSGETDWFYTEEMFEEAL